MSEGAFFYVIGRGQVDTLFFYYINPLLPWQKKWAIMNEGGVNMSIYRMQKPCWIFSLLLFGLYGRFLLGENPEMQDTTLFFLDGESVSLGIFPDVVSVAPITVGLLYAACLACVVISFFIHWQHIVLPAANLCLAVPVMSVFYRTLLFQPFYTDGAGMRVSLLKWVWFFWLALLCFLWTIAWCIHGFLYRRGLLDDQNRGNANG